MLQQERRQYSRKTLNPLPYINLPSENGGIVLDVSEQGLRFRAIGPVEPSGQILFSFTARSTLVAGIGELVWFDPANKTGGLRFTELPYKALEQIRKWPHDSNLRLGIGQDLTLHMPTPDESPSSRTTQRGAYASLKSKVASEFDRLLPDSFGAKVRESLPPILGNALTGISSLTPEGYFQKHRQSLLKTTFAVFLGIVISTVVYVGHRKTGEMLIRLGARLSGGTAAVTPAPAVASQAPRVDPVPDAAAKVDVPAAEAVPPPVSADAGKIASEISAPTPAPQPKETTTRPPKHEVAGTELVLQVAALTEEIEARKLSDKLRQENFQAFVGTLPVDSFYRVMVGPYPNEASARAVLGKLKKAGFNSFIRRESIAVAERLGS
jgi:cell division septation protein DedD